MDSSPTKSQVTSDAQRSSHTLRAHLAVPSGLCLLLLSCLLILFIPVRAGEHRSPVVVKSTTTVERGTGHPIIELPSDIPAWFILEIIPAGGTLGLRFDGDLLVTWNDDSVSVADSFDVYARLDMNAMSVGEAVLEFSYLLRPSYRINLDTLFHDPTGYWGADDPRLLGFPDSGIVEDRFPLVDSVPECSIRRFVTIGVQDSLFLLGDSLVSGPGWEDTVKVSFEHSPYPCVHMTAVATVRTSLAFTVATDTFCIRYSSSEEDTLCWEAETGFDCQTGRRPPWRFRIGVPCEETVDWVVPLCPIRASGHGHVEIGTEVTLDTLVLDYEQRCTSPAGSLWATPVYKDTTWIEQGIFFGTDRDDAIFAVPVPLDKVNVALLDAAADTLDAFDVIYVDSTYTVAWTPIDLTLDGCCPDNSLRIAYRDTMTTDTTCCFGTVVDQFPSDSLRFSWTVPDTNSTCLRNGEGLRLFLEFSCDSSGSILYRAWSKSFIYNE